MARAGHAGCRRGRRPLAALVALGFGLGTAGGVMAQSRPATPGMTCAAAAALVARTGAAVLSTSATTFDRFVRDRSFCTPDEAVRPAFVSTRDNPQCFIGYTCYEPERGHWPW